MSMTDIETKIYLGHPNLGISEVHNGGFEVLGAGPPVFKDWNEGGGSAGIIDETVLVNSGSHALKLSNTGVGDVWVWQVYSVTAHEKYKLSFWTRGDGSVAGRYFMNDDTQGNPIIAETGTGIIDTTYTLFEVEFTIPEGCALIGFRLSEPGTAGVAYFDDVSVNLMTSHYVENTDVLVEPPTSWEMGLPGTSPLDLVADTGILTTYLDNSKSNSEGLAGLYSPDNANTLVGFEDGMPVRVIMGLPVTGEPNLILNPGFETAGGGGDDVFANWAEKAGHGGLISDEGVIVHGGSHACKLSKPGGIWQDVMTPSFTVVPGTLLRLSFWTRGDGGSAEGEYFIRDVTNAVTIVNLATGVTGTTYTEIIEDFVVPEGCVSLYIKLRTIGPYGDIYFDDVSLQVIMSKASDRFLGNIAGIRPTSGLFENPITEVEAHDFMGFLSSQEAGILTVENDKRADEALTTLISNFVVQPNNTDFDVGEETFTAIFVGDKPETSMASLFQKLAQNEMGRIYLQGDGTLRFENRHTRPENRTIAFTLAGIMTELDVSYEQPSIFNFITTRVLPRKVDTAATTLVWDLTGAPEIKAGETLIFVCPYTDPNTGDKIDAIEINDPPVTEFGSVQDFTSDDMADFLTIVMNIGANSTEVRLTNTHQFQTGYLNDLQVKGKGIYTYDAILSQAIDDESISVRGPRKKLVKLDLLTDPTKGRNYAYYILGKISKPHLKSGIIMFLANQTSTLAEAVLDLEISDRFTASETVTGVNRDFYINRLRYRLIDGMVWVSILPAPESFGMFIWDASHWDSEDAHWGL